MEFTTLSTTGNAMHVGWRCEAPAHQVAVLRYGWYRRDPAEDAIEDANTEDQPKPVVDHLGTEWPE